MFPSIINYQDIIEALPGIVVVFDDNNSIVFINQRGREYFGLLETIERPLTARNVIPIEDWPEAARLWSNKNISGMYALIQRLRRADGVYRWHKIRGQPVRDEAGVIQQWVILCTDIDEQRRAEDERDRAIHQQQQTMALLDTLQGEAPLGFGFLDQEFRYRRINETLALMNGIAVEAHLGRSIEELLPELWLQLRPILTQVLVTGVPVVNLEVNAETPAKPGEPRTWMASYYPVTVDGERIGIGLIVAEITEKRQLELQLRQSQKMEAVGRLAGGVAHDFNNLLTVINGYSTLLLDEPIEDPVIKDGLVAIGEAGERAVLLVRQLLAFSRKQRFLSHVTDLALAVRRIDQLLRRLIGEDVILEISVSSEPMQVYVDPGQIEQVIMNLAVNARDAMPQGGRLFIEAGMTTISEPILLPDEVIPPDQYVYLEVRDTGQGMSGETKARLFEPFFTTKPVGQGTGLGLAMVYGIVKQGGGFIHVESTLGAGSTFRLYFPPASEPPLLALFEPDQAQLEPGSGTVLLVEDDPAVRKFVRRVLSLHSYAVIEAANGADAVRVVEQYGGTIELVITDVVMPEMSGRELVERLLALAPAIKVLFVSGYTEDALDRHGIVPGTTFFLSKPFLPAALIQQIQAALLTPPPSAV